MVLFSSVKYCAVKMCVHGPYVEDTKYTLSQILSVSESGLHPQGLSGAEKLRLGVATEMRQSSKQNFFDWKAPY